VIGSPFLAGRDRYERVMEGWVDNTHDAAFTHTVRITDADGGVEVSMVATPSPGYEVQAASARALSGADPGIAGDLAGLAGARMVGGFTRRLAELCAGEAEPQAPRQTQGRHQETATNPAQRVVGHRHDQGHDRGLWLGLPGGGARLA
jgi:hypothetical protein